MPYSEQDGRDGVGEEYWSVLTTGSLQLGRPANYLSSPGEVTIKHLECVQHPDSSTGHFKQHTIGTWHTSHSSLQALGTLQLRSWINLKMAPTLGTFKNDDEHKLILHSICEESFYSDFDIRHPVKNPRRNTTRQADW